jgi:methylase of polypeptide subunit release factors
MSNSPSPAITVREAASGSQRTALDRPGRSHGPLRRALRNTLHYLSYHFVLKRPKTQVSRAAGFQLTVPPTVFHPGYFISSEAFAKFVDGLDLSGRTAVDVGTGSGIIALAAARAGAQTVIATDINPNAGAAAAENARANGLGGKVKGLCCDLLAAIEPKPIFDVVFSSPPKHAGEPKDLADAGWHAGAGNRNILNVFQQARERLKPGGRFYLMISSDSDLDLYGKAIADAGFHARLAVEHSILFESFLLYELTQ